MNDGIIRKHDWGGQTPSVEGVHPRTQRINEEQTKLEVVMTKTDLWMNDGIIRKHDLDYWGSQTTSKVSIRTQRINEEQTKL